MNDIIENSIINNMLRLVNNDNNINRLRLGRIISRRYYNVPPLGGYIVNDEDEYIIDTDDISSLVFLDTITELLNDDNNHTNNTNHTNNNQKTKIKSIGGYKKIKESHVELLNEHCPICIEKFNTGEYYRTLKCNHSFHKKCIDRWIKKDKNECPMCSCLLYTSPSPRD